MRHRTQTAFSILLAASLGTVALGQSDAQDRERRPIVQVTKIGDGTPVVLRWRPSPDQKSTVQVSTRTLPTALEKPDIDDIDPEVVLTGFAQPPIEKLWTIEGRIERKTEDVGRDERIRWRVLDAVARMVGIKETRAARETSDPAGDGEARPDTPTKQPADARLNPSAGTPTESTPDAVARAVKLEQVINGGLSGTKGAAITQVLGGTGIVPAATTVRLENTSRRAQFESDVLKHAMEMIEIQLPSEPIGIGGTWTSRWKRRMNNVDVEVVVDATLLAVDEAATAGVRVAREATVQVEYRRRAVDPTVKARLKRICEADGRGRLQLNLDAPLRLDARLVETPPGPTQPGVTRTVTRIRATSIR